MWQRWGPGRWAGRYGGWDEGREGSKGRLQEDAGVRQGAACVHACVWPSRHGTAPMVQGRRPSPPLECFQSPAPHTSDLRPSRHRVHAVGPTMERPRTLPQTLHTAGAYAQSKPFPPLVSHGVYAPPHRKRASAPTHHHAAALTPQPALSKHGHMAPAGMHANPVLHRFGVHATADAATPHHAPSLAMHWGAKHPAARHESHHD